MVEFAVGHRPPTIVEFVEIAVEAKERAKQCGSRKCIERGKLVDAVLERGAGEHEGVRLRSRLIAWVVLALQFLMRWASSSTTTSGWRKRVLTSSASAEHLLVVDDGEGREVGVVP